MNFEKELHQEKTQFTIHTVDKEKFIESFWAKVEHQEKLSMAQPRRRRIIVSSAAVVLAGGVVVSPMIASAVRKIPVVQVVLNWAKGTDVAPYVRNVQQSSTDHGITMTITDVLYGPSQLSFGYIVSPGQPGFPHGGVVSLGPQNMRFFANGKQVQLQGMSSDEPTAYGFKGMVMLTNAGTVTTLPSAFHLQIIVYKIGNQFGTWKFNVPVSRKNMSSNQSYLPMITERISNETITIKEVRFYPTGGMIDYDVTVPSRVKPSLDMTLFAQNKRLLDFVSAEPGTSISHVTHGRFEIWSYNQPFRIPGQKPTSLIIDASIPSTIKSRLAPVTGPFPLTMTSKVFGKLVITGSDIKGNAVTVHYKSSKNPVTPGFGFSIENITHPHEDFGGEIGVKDGPSGSHAYMNVYHFSSNVSSDKLMLRLPPNMKDNVFEVPLRNNLK